jgi:hypothetical protein
MPFGDALLEAVADVGPPGASGGEKKNYTEKISAALTTLVAARLRELGLREARAPQRGRDKQFMGGYGTKGVDAYVSDEKHGLLLSWGTEGILFDVRKNLKNRYRDMVMEALELHKRFPYAVCGHLFFLGRDDAMERSIAFGTVLGEAVTLLKGITGRFRPDESAELYETMGILLLPPGDASSIDLRPTGVPDHLTADSYCERLVDAFRQRNPFLFVEPEQEPIAPVAGVDPAASVAAAPAISKKRTR